VLHLKCLVNAQYIMKSKLIALLFAILCVFPACLIFEDEPFPDPLAHCVNGIYDENEEGIDCGTVCGILCYQEPSCITTHNQITCDLGTFTFASNGTPTNSTSSDYTAFGQDQFGSTKIWITLDGLDNYTKSQSVFDADYANEIGEIEIDIEFGNFNPSSPLFSTQGHIPFEYNELENTFTLHFCNVPILIYPNTQWNPNTFTGSITFSVE